MRHPTELHNGDVAWKTVRVLVFSADDAFRFLVRQTFRKLNVREVLSTSVPADATPMMKQAPDIALVDLDGDVAAAIAFLERVRAADAEIPVLAMAGTEKTGAPDALRLGIEGLVPKRVSGHELSHRVAETLKDPRRLPPPAEAKPKPAVVLPPRPAAAPSPEAPPPGAIGGAPDPVKAELAALTARLAANSKVLGGGAAAPTPRPAPPPARTAARGGDGGTWGGDAPAAKRPSGGTLDLDDLAPAPAARGGKLDDDDIAAAPVGVKGGTLDLRPLSDDERAAAEKRKAAWQEELAQSGHTARAGKDVAGLDVSAIVAAHGEWLATKGAGGKRANFQGMDLAGGDLSAAVLANATFRDAELSDATLAESRLDGCDFRYAKMGATDLAGADLGVAQLRHADLRLANLEGANLRGADLSGARLAGARLAGADFGGAVLVSTDLCDADLSQVDKLGQAQVDKAICDMKTKLPPGISRPRRPDGE
ncbi:pentapeptide repeat-containing protein [Magnetospirillum sp. UT-4]|uniref:pentapeptide repeat-containing protein n=1 Tax=Magnetospirillum sp. UT-4 TaxID=2681467 RepID=UPI0013809E98|nr:pentapeptide repeat-containing protein [Magnetospirillum sp. UT-4]CAA7624383.1 Low-complexity proteins [Magnetospirillum sp. UT-4]